MSHQDLIVLLKLFCGLLAAFGLIVLEIMHQDNTKRDEKRNKKRKWKLLDTAFFVVLQNRGAT
ncbi:MAG: hypothetical protein WBI40_03645 [Methylococcaceae bacterium]